MGERKKESEFDELDILLGEIPNVTSGNPRFEDYSGLISSPSKDFKRASLHYDLSHKSPTSIHMNSLELDFDGMKQNSGIVENPEMTGDKILQSVINGRSVQSLTSAFSELNYSDNRVANPTHAVYKPLLNHTFMVDNHFPTRLENQPPIMGSPGMVTSSPQSPNSLTGDFRRERSEFYKFDVEGLKQACFSHPSGNNFPATVPFAHGMQCLQFFSNVPVPHMECPLMADQQQYFLDAHSQVQYFHSQRVGQPHIAWGQVEEDQYYRMHQQCLYWQQHRNRGSESHSPILSNDSVSAVLMSRPRMQPYYGMPASNQHLESNPKPCENGYAVSKGLNQSNPPILDKANKHMFPEKILTRSHGLNSIRSTKYSSFGRNEQSPNHFHQNRRILANGHSSPGHLCSDSVLSQGMSPQTADVKHTHLRLQPLKYNFLDEACGKIYLMAKNQNGCRFLQRKFTEGTREDVNAIFLEIIDHIVKLMTDPFGNYLVQKLLEVCDEDQRMQILRTITRNSGDLVRISCDMHGTRAVQKIIETLKTPEQFSMVVSSLNSGIVTLIKNMNGNHVAQRCLQYFMPEYSGFLFEAAIANCVELATDRQGCCVLQKCLGHSDGDQRHRLICEITLNVLILCQDPFGNYVVQFVFELQVPWATMDILHQLQGSYGDLSMQKCSSNVVEKCLKYAGEEYRSVIIQELINNPRLDQIMQDPYGNYVIQAALNLSKGALHGALVEAIRPHIPVLRTNPYGKKVLSCHGIKK